MDVEASSLNRKCYFSGYYTNLKHESCPVKEKIICFADAINEQQENSVGCYFTILSSPYDKYLPALDVRNSFGVESLYIKSKCDSDSIESIVEYSGSRGRYHESQILQLISKLGAFGKYFVKLDSPDDVSEKLITFMSTDFSKKTRKLKIYSNLICPVR